ncbi:conserved hypothetical protein [Perkinsus marinus ATCC 50983]|uniref:Reverse transcriptase domain-containing protein n=1 Tax=Perkinsus marinus (strain ATCC 50983 / TXsc) TaxID=423536 RepID=C5K9A4_PERM5|nr:conserved hypothetical protein [Perkinsus marinus ATCC 50983]EER18945.1 conserved hypothetical protein [Perkinsus marinus ATCC 50983]|eukprot:XP_002787149.1 conserved hypothetical protein [Perkinsus marinus ATCC 50983]
MCMTKGGTPQGGVLSPVIYRLFHALVMDIPGRAVAQDVLVKTISYADDMIILIGVDSQEKLEEATKDIEALERELPTFGLAMAREKSAILSNDLQDECLGIVVKRSIPFLGMRIDLSGRWAPHVVYMM